MIGCIMGKKCEVSDVVWWSRNYVDELRRAGCTLVPARKEEGDRWRPPDQGKLKIKCDVTFDRGRRRIGFGSIIKDVGGRVMACCSQVCEANFDLETAKAMAVCKGLTFSRDCGLESCVVETDSEAVIKYIVKGGHSDSRYGSILDSIAAGFGFEECGSQVCV